MVSFRDISCVGVAVADVADEGCAPVVGAGVGVGVDV